MRKKYKSLIYKQSFDKLLEVKKVNPRELYCTTHCLDCEGTGEFVLMDNTVEKCVACKGSGKVYVSLL